MGNRSFIVGLLMSLVGCSASMGHKIDDARVKDIKNCVTTEKDLLAWFGAPSQRGSQNGMPTMQWMYSKTTAGFGTGSVEQQNLVVVLNPAGKVVQYQLNPTTFPEAKDTCQGQ
jgi:hypothetical protein